MKNGRKDRIERAIRALVKQFEGCEVTPALMDDVAQELELLLLQHAASPPEIKVKPGSKPGRLNVLVKALLSGN
jgi:hypothetical protein